MVPTTTGAVAPRHLDYYPRLEGCDTRAASRNVRSFRAATLGRRLCSATFEEMYAVVRQGLWRHLFYGLSGGPGEVNYFALGTVHNGLITNSRGAVGESWFLVLTYNDGNGLATVVKVDREPVGESTVRLPLTALEGPDDMAACAHGVQTVDLGASTEGFEGARYVGAVDRRSLASVVNRVSGLTMLPAPMGH